VEERQHATAVAVYTRASEDLDNELVRQLRHALAAAVASALAVATLAIKPSHHRAQRGVESWRIVGHQCEHGVRGKTPDEAVKKKKVKTECKSGRRALWLVRKGNVAAGEVVFTRAFEGCRVSLDCTNASKCVGNIF